MAKITYVEDDGTVRTVEVAPGLSVMEGAIRNNVPGILGNCGGACACATCHCYVDPAWADRVDAMGEMEEAMLEFAEDRRANSRLCCQIKVTEAIDGLVVQTPAEQG